MWRILVSLWLLAWAAAAAAAAAATTQPIHVGLQTSWNATYLLDEASEALAAESPALFWKLAQAAWAKQADGAVITWSSKASYDVALEVAESAALSKTSVAILKMSLAVHEFSAAIKAHHQVHSEYSPKGCNDGTAAWVLVDGAAACCSLAELTAALATTSESKPDSIALGHVFPKAASSATLHSAVLYGHLGDARTKLFHDVLAKEDNGVHYVFRHLHREHGHRAFIAGYGIGLSIKSTEYKAIDDSKLASSGDNAATSSNASDDGEEDATLPVTIEPIKQADLSGLSLKLFDKVLSSAAPLQTLRHLSQNLPSVAASVASHVSSQPKPDDQTAQAMDQRINWFQPALTINGLHVSASSMDGATVYSLLPILREERARVQPLVDFGFSNEQAIDIITNSQPRRGDGSQNIVIDIQNAPVIFLNDLAKDDMYARYPAGLSTILQPMYGGQLHYVRFNAVTVVFLVNPKVREHWIVLQRTMSHINRGVPMRFGVWFADPDSASLDPITDPFVQFMRVLQSIQANSPHQTVLHFMMEVCNSVLRSHEAKLTLDMVIRSARSYSTIAFETLSRDERNDVLWKASAQELVRVGLPVESMLVNGQYSPLEPSFEGPLSRTYNAQIDLLRRLVHERVIVDTNTIYQTVLSQPNVFPKYSTLISPPRNSWDGSEKPLPFVSLDAFVKLEPTFIAQPASGKVLATIVLVGDFSKTENVDALAQVLAHVSSSSTSRLAIVDSSKTAGPLQKLLDSLGTNDQALSILLAFSQDQASAAAEALVQQSTLTDAQWTGKQSKLRSALGLISTDSSSLTVIVNGRVVDDAAKFDKSDYDVLVRYEYSQRVQAIEETFSKMYSHPQMQKLSARKFSDALAVAVSTLGHNYNHRELLRNDWYVLNTFAAGSKDAGSCVLHVHAALDPFSASGQRLAGVLLMLDKIDDVCIDVSMQSAMSYNELPLKRYYRYAIAAEPKFDANGDIVPTKVVFNGIPADLLLTMAIDEPQPWLVGTAKAAEDLDNLKLTLGDIAIEAVYELERLVIEGHSFETNTGITPRGLQLILGTPASQDAVDTIVMWNYGYFQLQANPGQWQLRMRKGRSQNLYKFSSVPGDATVGDEEVQTVLVSSFVIDDLFAGVRKRPGKESQPLLTADGGDYESSGSIDDTGNNMWGSLFGTKKAGSSLTAYPKDTIHVFSLASGHLYERLLRIMIVSVLRHTKSPVKFWFIQNFASPQFKESIPVLAQEYKFDYEFVTYKWPRWVREQTEKQRIIWAYKILFLDVLFPLNVDRIIFVDADEIVRADLKELVELDLHGAPYGYTPFCDSRRETDGFRFWKQGWWQQHLQGKPYHISALYVVDLRRFRELAAGDRLRGQYQMLTQDPGSLANLDQDLPNNLQHDVPIYSLPQEWLFCETWCSDGELAKAKVIDLCNNPLTKEPKLAVAQRMLPEWNVYDQEIKALLDKSPPTPVPSDPHLHNSGTGKHDEL